MNDPNQVVVALVTVPDSETGQHIAITVVEERLAACGNTGAPVQSIYRWEEKICNEPEELLILKTTAARLPELTKRIQELHSYDVPEIIALPVVGGSDDYLNWVRAETE
jgi:periplasmic divalent cation tolerance protein